MSNPAEQTIHATAVALAVDPDGPLAGILLLGDSGTGKSILALEMLESCVWGRTALIADDQVELSAKRGRLWAGTTGIFDGILEIRGFGPTSVRRCSGANIVAGFDLDGPSSRLSDPAQREYGFAGVGPLSVWPLRDDCKPSRIRPIIRSVLAGQLP